MQVTREEFEAAIIGQDDDNDYSESGYVACVFPNGVAAIARYSHCSCYGTFESLCGGGISDHFASGNVVFDWTGTVEQMLQMAHDVADPIMPDRRATSDDCDYDHLIAVYGQIIDWNTKRQSAGA